MKLINDLKKEIAIFFKYCKKYKLFGGFVFIFVSLFMIKLILNIFLSYSNEILDMFYNVFLGLSMSALFYYWIEYKRKYETIKNNKFKISKKCKKIEKNVKEAYEKRHRIRWSAYNMEFDEIENLIEISFSYEWFDSHYIDSMLTMQKSIYYEILKGSLETSREHVKIGEKLYEEIGKEFYKIIFSLEEIQKIDLKNPIEELEKIKTHIKNRVNKNLENKIIEKYAYYIIEEINTINFFSIVICEIERISLELEV